MKVYKENGLNSLSRKERFDKGARRKVSTNIKNFIEGLALDKSKSIATIHRQVCKTAQRLKEPAPSYSITHNIINNIPKSILTLAHSGNKAYEQKFDLLCSDSITKSNEVWQSDHCLLDINLEYKNVPTRPWLTIISDSYSRAIAGYYLSFDAPSSIRVSLALRQAIWRKNEANWLICGIPEAFYTDNGTDFTSDHIAMVCADLKIRAIFSIPGKPRGRGKIERFFLTLDQRLLCQLPGYIKNKLDKRSLMTLEKLEYQVKDFLLNVYHSEPHSITKEPPIQRWNSNGFLPQMPSSLEKLDLLLLTIAKPRQVHPDGIHFQGLKYIDTILSSYIGESIVIRYDPRDMAEIRVLYGNKFLCRAICQDLSNETITLKEIISVRQKRKRELKKIISNRRSIVDQLLYTTENKLESNEKVIQKSKKVTIKLYHND